MKGEEITEKDTFHVQHAAVRSRKGPFTEKKEEIMEVQAVFQVIRVPLQDRSLPFDHQP
jgi:hypothetical protein